MFNLKNLTNWLAEVLVGAQGGKYVTPDTAIKYPPIWYAVNKIAGHVGQLPLVLHRRMPDDRGSEVASSHPAYKLLKLAPNDWQTPIVFKELLTSHALLWGNAYAYIRYQGSRPVELIPLYPGRTAPQVVAGVKGFIHLPETIDDPILKYLRPSEQNYVAMDDDEVLHIPGLGFDGFAGKSLWKVASDSWAIGLESDNRIKNGFQKGFKAAMLLEAPPEAFRKEEDARQFIKDFNDYHSGSDNADKVGLLTRGIKANVTQMNSQEAQMVEHRRYQRQDAALWFLLESILGDDSSVSYNSLEQKNLAYLSNCLMRWLVKWEEECNRKLLTVGSDRYYFKFNVSALLRADHKTTIETLSLGINSRIYSPNEAREKLDMNPYTGGDSYENPAITPGQTGATEEEESEDDQQEEEEQEEEQRPSDRFRPIVSHMIGVEMNRLAEIAKKDDAFARAVAFYERWCETLKKAFVNAGMVEHVVDTHCEDVLELMLTAAKEEAKFADWLAQHAANETVKQCAIDAICADQDMYSGA